MININLSDRSKSDIDYEIKVRTDGQQDITLKLKQGVALSGITDTGKSWSLGVTIQSRLPSFRQFELIIGVVTDLRRLGVEEIHLFIPYLLGARGDRPFEVGGNSYLVDVIAPTINMLNFKSVTVMDAHSDVAQACIKNLRTVDNIFLVNKAINSLVVEHKRVLDTVVLLSPDAGALKKVYTIAERIGFTGDVIVASKHRSTVSNEILTTTVPYKNTYSDKTIIIVDDICDGGRTFIEIAKAIRADNKHQGKIVLVVTHGIFSYGFEQLTGLFDLIVTTNSVKSKEEMIVDESKVKSEFLRVVEVI